MTSRGIKSNPSEDIDADEVITAQAAAWHALFLSGEATENDERRFRVWLRSDPKRESVYTDLVKTWERVDALAPVFENDILKIRAATKSVSGQPLFAGTASRAHFGIVARVSSAVLAAAFFIFATFVYYQSPIYEVTLASSREPVVRELADGSSVQLNASTEVEISFTRSKRSLKLISGQAFFDVAKDASRPFIVTAGDRRVVAVGTAFDIIKKRNGLTVTLHEGIVDISPTIEAARGGGAIAATVRLAPGEQLGYERGFSPVVQTVEPGRFSAWRNGRIDLRDVSLSDAIEQINLYSDRRLVLADHGLRDVRLDFSGPLGPNTADAFLSAIEIKYAVQATSVNQRIVYLRQKPSNKNQ